MLPFEYLGPYRVEKPLGRGGMGAVFLAVHAKTGEQVAVKVIAQHLADEPRFRRRFDREVKALQLLRHPGIVRLIGFGEEQGQLFYSMELIEGETLQARIRRLKRIDWRETIEIAIQICAALKHAHDIGVTHRDLKPANLILTPEGVVKLVDFGIPKVFGDDGEQTMVGSVLGTADYMAPEQATSSGITPRTDLYAVGSLMYAMLAGRPPFTGKKVTEVIESLKRERPIPLDMISVEIPAELVDLVHQLLEKDPNDRPPTALAVLNRLKAMRAGLARDQTLLIDDLPTEAIVKSTPTSHTGKFASRDSELEIDTPPPRSGMRRPTVQCDPGMEPPAHASPSDITVVAHGRDSRTVRPEDSVVDQDDDVLPPPAAKTHFQTVDAIALSSGLFSEPSEPSTPRWVQWATVTGMILFLLFGCWMFWYAVRPPTAEQLYQTAITTGDPGAIKTFLRRFPDNPRSEELFQLHMSTRLKGVLKRLRTQDKLGITPLDPAQEGFLLAMDERELEPQQAADKLQQWLNVFDDPASGRKTDSMIELLELAKHERQQLLTRKPEMVVVPKAQEIIDDIHNSVANSDPEALRRKLIGIIETFGDLPWAKPAVDEARAQLVILDEQSP